jgi:hypothetical protein
MSSFTSSYRTEGFFNPRWSRRTPGDGEANLFLWRRRIAYESGPGGLSERAMQICFNLFRK